MKQIPSASDQLVVYGDFHGFTPDELFDHWIDPELVTQWWPRQVVIDPREGGAYRFTWPDQGWFLQGTYGAFVRGKHLRFSWTWNFEPGVYEPLWVDIYFMEIDHGTRMSIFHGPYSDSESDQGARQGNLEGWIHFCSRLAGLRVGEPE
jgi:uncharacterized protein YndB with AHSA1/START domain